MPEAMLPAMPSALHHCVAIETQRRGHARRSAERTEHRGGMKPRLVHALGRHQAQAAHDFATHGDAARDVAAGEPVLLGRGEHRRDDHGAGVHRAAFEGVVVVLAVRGGAVAQRRGGDVEAAGMTDQRARTGFRARAQRGLHVVAVARGHAQAGDVHQHGVAHRRHGGGKRWRHAGERGRELLRDGKFRERHRARRGSHSASILLARATAVQCAISSAMYLPNCAGVIGITLSACAR